MKHLYAHGAAVCAFVAAFAVTGKAQSMFHRAENNVPIAIIQVVRTADDIAVKLQTLRAIAKVCWTADGPNSPYLVADGRRYRYLSGDNVSACPQRTDYAESDIMILHFEPLDSKVRIFSLVEGEGGENQMANAQSSDRRYWNFLRVTLN